MRLQAVVAVRRFLGLGLVRTQDMVTGKEMCYLWSYLPLPLFERRHRAQAPVARVKCSLCVRPLTAAKACELQLM